MRDPTKPFNIHRKDPQRKPPPGWTVSNVLFQRLLTQATRTGCPSLVDQVETFRDADRKTIVLLLEPVTQAAKGLLDPEALNLEDVLRG